MKDLKKGFFAFWVYNIRLTYLVVFLILISGIFSLFAIPKESSPDIKFGIISVNVSYPGVNPTDMDALVTEKIEKEIQDIDGIKKITSSSGIGFSSVVSELYNGIDTRDVMTDIKDKMDTIDFPEDANDPIVTEVSTSNELMFEVNLYGNADNFTPFELAQKAKIIQNALEGKNGIVSIDIGSASSARADATISELGDYDIEVRLKKNTLDALGIGVGDVANIIRSENKNFPIGNYEIGNLNYDFRMDGEFRSLEELQNTIIRGDIRLKDIANIEKKYALESENRFGFYDDGGYRYVSLLFNKKQGANIFAVSKSAKAALENFLTNNPDFVGLDVRFSKDLSDIIIDDYKNLGQTALQTLFFVFIVIFLFIGFKESLIASIILPLSFLITFIILDQIGLSLNFLTNFSLVLTLGIAIDTVIVVIEGASERLRLGYNRFHAMLLSLRDLRAPLIAGTMTTLVAFLPMMFLPGIMGRFLAYIPITVFCTLLAALVLSLTISSGLFVSLGREPKKYHTDPIIEKTLSEDEKDTLREDRAERNSALSHGLSLREKIFENIGSWYARVLKKNISGRKKRWLSIGTPFVGLILTFVFLAGQIGFTLFPETDEGVVTVTLEAKAGTSETYLEQFLPDAENIAVQQEEVDLYTAWVAGDSIFLYIELKDKDERFSAGMRDVFEFSSDIEEALAFFTQQGFQVKVATLENGPPGVAPVGIKLVAQSTAYMAQLEAVSADFEVFLKGLEGTKNISLTSKRSPGQFVFEFDRKKLQSVGLTPSDIALPLQQSFFGITAGSVKTGLEDNDIKVFFDEFDTSLNPEDVKNMVVNTKIGPVQVGEYIDYNVTSALSSIGRENGKIIIGVNADVFPGIQPSHIQPKLIEFAEQYSFPSGISFSAGGENEENAELIASTLMSFGIALFLIFSILVFQLDSFSQPAIILYSVVLALLGVNIGLFLTNNPYSMPFAIGFIALTGVVVNDAIILVDKMNKNVKRLQKKFGKANISHKEYYETIVSAAKSRLQPIMVTTLTTVFGVLPLALQDKFWAGLGYTIIFGLFAASAMTLFVIPCLYIEVYLRRKLKKVVK